MTGINLFDWRFLIKDVIPFGGIDLLTNKKKGWLSYFWSMLMILVLIALQTSIIFWSWAILNLQCLRSGRTLHLGYLSTIQITVFLFLGYYYWVLGFIVFEYFESFLERVVLKFFRRVLHLTIQYIISINIIKDYLLIYI